MIEFLQCKFHTNINMPCYTSFAQINLENIIQWLTVMQNYMIFIDYIKKLYLYKKCQKIDIRCVYISNIVHIYFFVKFTILCTNHFANHRVTTSPDTNRSRAICNYSIRLIDTWEIERTYQRQRQTAVSRFLHSRRWQDIYLYYLPR